MSNTHKWYVHGVTLYWYQARKTLKTMIKESGRIYVERIKIKSVDMFSRELRKVMAIAHPGGHRSQDQVRQLETGPVYKERSTTKRIPREENFS